MGNGPGTRCVASGTSPMVVPDAAGSRYRLLTNKNICTMNEKKLKELDEEEMSQVAGGNKLGSATPFRGR